MNSVNQLESKKNKCKQTCLEKYGCENVFQNNKIKDKIRATNNEKYGCDVSTQNEEIKAKIRATNNEKYGVDYPTMLESHKKKCYETMKRNNSFRKSPHEEQIFREFKKYFPKIIRGYSSKVYPFKSDFYIPISDLYIEYHGSWVHGAEPFNSKNKDHLAILEDWRTKATGKGFYEGAIYTWSDLDVRKAQIAKRNHLNFKAFYSLKEVYDWLTTLKAKSYYNKLEFKSIKYNKLWKNNKIRRKIFDWCQKQLGLLIGEVKKKDIIQALKELY